MKIVAFNGSPRAEQSNTQVMLQAFLQGAQDAGARTETVFLGQKKIHHCLGCFSCWFKTPGACIQNDDMPGLIERYTGADVAVLPDRCITTIFRVC